MMFKEALVKFLDNKCSPKNFQDHLSSFQKNIWKTGLVEEEIHLCVQIFLEFGNLDQDVRRLLLQCMVPHSRVPHGTVKALLAWFFSNKEKNVKDCKLLLSWFSVMLSNNLIDTTLFEKVFNQLVLCFYITELIPSLCSMLRYVIKPNTVTPRSVFIASSYYNQPVRYPEKKHIACLLRLFHDCSPSLVLNPPPGNATLCNSVTQFQQAVSALAFELGFLDTLPECILPKSVCQSSSSRQVTKRGNNIKTQLKEDFMETVTDLPSLDRMKFLGCLIKQNKIPTILNASSIIESKAGQIYICWKHIFGDDQAEDFFNVPPLLPNVLKTCQRMRCGWPELSISLSRQLITWDGEEAEEVLFNVLSLIYFYTYEELFPKFLVYILHIFCTGTLKNKVNIIDCLTNLIINKVTTVPKEVTVQLIKFVSMLIKILHASDGLQTSTFFFSSILFYQHMSHLEENYILGTWTIPPPFLVFGAFFSNNPILISDICELIVRHNIVMYPFFISLGIIEQFAQEQEIIKTYLRDLYLFLWKGKASITEFVSSDEENMPWATPHMIDSALTVRSHFGIHPLVLYIVSQNEVNILKSLNEKSLLKLLDKYAPGLSSVKRTYEGSHEMSSC